MKAKDIVAIFSNLPTLETERLILRKMSPRDRDDMYEYASSTALTRYLLWYPHRDPEFTLEYLNYLQSRYSAGSFYDWAVIVKETGKMIGTCGFTSFDKEANSAEIGYVISLSYSGCGYATEAAKKVIEYGIRELGLHRIEARIMKGNNASLRVAEKLGMRFEGYHRDMMYVKGEYRTIGICALLDKDI